MPGLLHTLDLHNAVESVPDFRRKATIGLAIAGLVIMAPFSINNFVQGRYLLGFGSLVIVVVLAINGWYTSRGRDASTLVFFGLVPAIVFFLTLSIRNQGMVGVMWCYPALISFYMLLPERKAWVANIALLLIVTPQAWIVLEHPLAVRMVATLVAVSAFTLLFVRALSEQHNRLQTLAVTDPLTGLYNRSLMQAHLQQAIEQNQRSGTPMALAALDLDHFKTINDSLGHEAGDGVLCNVADLLQQRLRSVDKVYRLGGEEFLLLLHDTTVEQAMQLAEELRLRISAISLPSGNNVTASIGTTQLQQDDTPEQWMKRTDDLLYRAKLEGRDRVVTT